MKFIKWMKKSWMYLLPLILIELMVLGVIIGIDYAVTNQIPELQKIAEIGTFKFTYEYLLIHTMLITITYILIKLISILWSYFFDKVMDKRKEVYKDENRTR